MKVTVEFDTPEQVYEFLQKIGAGSVQVTLGGPVANGHKPPPKPKAEKPERATPPPKGDKLLCPECDATYAYPKALDKHRYVAHGVEMLT